MATKSQKAGRTNRPIKVYLDINIFINLGQARYRPEAEHRPGSDRALHAVIQAAHDGTAIFPISAALVLEASKNGDMGRRERLRQILIEISRGWAVADRQSLLREEIRSAIAKTFNKQRPPHATPMFAKHGVPFALGYHEEIIKEIGIPNDQRASVLASFGCDEALSFFLGGADEPHARLIMRQINELERRQAAHDQRARQLFAAHDSETVRRTYLDLLISDNIDEIATIFAEFGMSLSVLMNQRPELARAVFESIPQIDVEAALFARRNAQGDHQIKPSDMMDLAHLGLAIPYYDIVVTEPQWVSLAKQSRLVGKYRAKMLSDLNELAENLEQISTASET
jgi:hypothetical protein